MLAPTHEVKRFSFKKRYFTSKHEWVKERQEMYRNKLKQFFGRLFCSDETEKSIFVLQNIKLSRVVG